MSRTPEQNLDGVMRYLRHMEPKREQFEQVTRYDIAALQARMDCMEAHIAQVTIPRQSRGHSGCEPLKAAVRGR